MQFNIPAEHKNASGVYIIRNSVNAKVYVGSAKNFWKRYIRHISCINTGKHHSSKLQNFVLKYGLDKLSFALLELCEPSKEIYLVCEQKWLGQLQCCATGFNVSPTASSRLGAKGKPLSEEQKAAIRKAHTGRIVSPETRQRISEACKGRKPSDATVAKIQTARAGYVPTAETRAKMSAARKGKKLNLSDEQRGRISERHKGRKHSDEARAKMSETRKGRKASEETKQKMREAHARSSTPEVRAIRVANRLRTLAANGPIQRPSVSQETRAKLSEAGKGRMFSEETRLKISETNRGRIPSEESRRKMSEAARNRCGKKASVVASKQLHLSL